MGGTKDAKTSRGRPEIDRIQLRYLLLESIDPTLIHWNHKVDSVVELDGKYRLDFRGGQESQTGFDLIVGSDGCWSKVRKRITDELPYYSGVSGVSFKISDPQKRCLDMYELVNRGSLFAFGDHKAVTSQQINDGGCLSVSYWTLAPDDWIDKFKDKTSTDVDFHKQACLEELDGWDPRLRKLLEVADSHAISRQLFMLPVGITWTNKPGLTLLGDAAHVMTPFAGEGVNLAMSDAMNLVTAIENAVTIGTHDALYAEVAAYENDMFVRATKVQQQTYDMMSASLLDEGGVDKNIEKYIMAAVGDQLPTYVRPIAGFMTRCIYGVLRWWRPPRS
jgi:2-polyprenyl-6-methoxyphenol hydroxylase-like FAD-dependent oxidoreductase